MQSQIQSIPAFTIGFGANSWQHVFGFVRVLKVVQNDDGMVTAIVLRNPEDYGSYTIEFTCLGDGFNFDMEEKGEYLGTFVDEGGYDIHLFVKMNK